jgi:hypothetical protein
VPLLGLERKKMWKERRWERVIDRKKYVVK